MKNTSIMLSIFAISVCSMRTYAVPVIEYSHTGVEIKRQDNSDQEVKQAAPIVDDTKEGSDEE